MVSKMHRLLSLVLCVLTVMSLLAVGMASASAAAGDTVYCENAAGWSEVYCYMWTGGNNNGTWPGQKMTKGENNLWSYQVTGDWSNIIFNNGSGDKTADLSYPGNGSCFNNSSKEWTTVDTPTNPTNP
ncbi:MAG: starch-binding protein, partial [Eubacteriales bacterium]|nr:starch-binding protein [Eubacteriales bacterium]